MSNDIAAFIAVRLDEDEAAAIEGRPDPSDPRTGEWTDYGHHPTPQDRRQDRDVQMVGTETEETGWMVCEVGQFDRAAMIAAHIARYDPARALRNVSSTRRLVAEVTAMPHLYVEGDSWFSCSQAVSEWRPDEGPGSGCSDEKRAGKPCDCGRDAKVGRMLGIVAGRWSDHPDYRPE